MSYSEWSRTAGPEWSRNERSYVERGGGPNGAQPVRGRSGEWSWQETQPRLHREIPPYMPGGDGSLEGVSFNIYNFIYIYIHIYIIEHPGAMFVLTCEYVNNILCLIK